MEEMQKIKTSTSTPTTYDTKQKSIIPIWIEKETQPTSDYYYFIIRYYIILQKAIDGKM